MLPSFSFDDESVVEVAMPTVTLLLATRGGEEGDDDDEEDPNTIHLGETAYDLLQTTMNDYLERVVGEYFRRSTTTTRNYELLKVRTEITEVYSYRLADGTTIGGKAITLETLLTFRDTTMLVSMEEEENTNTNENGIGADENRGASASASTSTIPTEAEIADAAGVAWNDLTMYYNQLLVATTLDDIDAFATVTTITSKQDFPTLATNANNDSGNNNDNNKDVDAKDLNGTGTGNTNGFTVAAASDTSSQLAQGNSSSINPLFPVAIVGLALFLFTVIFIGYRRQRRNFQKYHNDDDDDDDDDDDKTDDATTIVRGNVDDKSGFALETNDTGEEHSSFGDENGSDDRRNPKKKKERTKQQKKERSGWFSFRKRSSSSQSNNANDHNTDTEFQTTILAYDEGGYSYEDNAITQENPSLLSRNTKQNKEVVEAEELPPHKEEEKEEEQLQSSSLMGMSNPFACSSNNFDMLKLVADDDDSNTNLASTANTITQKNNDNSQQNMSCSAPSPKVYIF